MLKHYVELDYPGTFFPETKVKEIASREDFQPPFGKGLYAFAFFDREEVELNGEKLTSAAKNRLLDNARINGWDILVLCPAGNWQPLQEGESLIET